MHYKKSELQIGKESSGISSDFNPTPPLNNHHLQIQINNHLLQSHPQIQSPTNQTLQNETPPTILSTPHKRPLMNHSPTLSSLQHSPSPLTNPSARSPLNPNLPHLFISAFRHYFRRLRIHHHRRRLLILLSFPSLYFFLSNPTRSFFLDLISAVAFSVVLLLSINLALPRLPSIRLFLRRSFPLKLPTNSSRQPPPPVLWSIGSNPKPEKRPFSGCCVQAYSNGDVYEGEFHRGKCSGSGVYYYYLSGRYEGDWVDEKYDGYGVETWARGSRYRGQYCKGLRHGFGIYRFYTGDVYAGEWSNGQSHGSGIHTCEDGSRYVGEFKWGVKHGRGHYHFRNGDTYFGEYFADKMHGFGVYQFANGHRYEGAWHEGRRQGLGMYTFRNGETQSGHWQNGILDTLSTQSTHAGIPVAVNHSKVLNAVQEARRAAEKAFNVPRVDDRVNKAVAAANKAANAARVAAVKAVQKRMNRNNDDFSIPFV